ncbi:MAG TPA: type 1 glutamine amidotransferase [Syntrophomonadaceae bacterium]|nr:type 1 glutamine amidotransferase [Syntrophomonadaceae bacterium]
MQALVVQHVACEGPGLLEHVLVEKGWRLDIRCMDRPGAALPESLGNHNAFVILGGPMGAYEEEIYPYLLQVQELIREAVRMRLPTLGICLGGQLIARALGAKVEPNPVKEIGWYRVRLTPAGRLVPLFTGMPPEMPVFQWHGDTFALPKGALLLAEGDSCLNQAFVYGAHVYGGYAWGLQFHLEVSPEMIEEWAKLYADELVDFGGPGAADRLLQETRARWEKIRPFQELFLNNVEKVLRGTGLAG